MNKQQEAWFVLKTYYCREKMVQEELNRWGIESFIPMKCQEVCKENNKQQLWVPAIRNLIFVYSLPQKIDSFIVNSNSKVYLFSN